MLNQRVLDKLQKRKTKVATYNLDLNLVGDYWGLFGKRWYHHTGMVSTWSAPLAPSLFLCFRSHLPAPVFIAATLKRFLLALCKHWLAGTQCNARPYVS